ncbi:hypothetical protein QZN30_05750 [Burkholderia multivorans]|nr:hypothetical protein [Burkholderia multivorans]
MEHWIVDDVRDAGKWLIYDENSTDDGSCIRVQGSKELAQRVADGLYKDQVA